MKTSTSDLRNLLHGSRSFAYADLLTVTLADATVARWTTSVYDITTGGNTYTAGASSTAPAIQLGTLREAIGLEVSTLELTLGCGSTAAIGGTDLRQLAVTGGFDDARVSVTRAYMATPGGPVVGTVDRFSGVSTDCEADSNEVRLRVQSDIYRFSEVLPRHLIREKCVWALGDAGCGVNLASFTATDTCDSGCTQTDIYFTRAGPLFYLLEGGTITFTSGALNGLVRTIRVEAYVGVTPRTYQLTVNQLPVAPTVGDGISVVAGCNKVFQVCNSIFGNAARRRGFDFVPPPDSVS